MLGSSSSPSRSAPLQFLTKYGPWIFVETTGVLDRPQSCARLPNAHHGAGLFERTEKQASLHTSMKGLEVSNNRITRPHPYHSSGASVALVTINTQEQHASRFIPWADTERMMIRSIKCSSGRWIPWRARSAPCRGAQHPVLLSRRRRHLRLSPRTVPTTARLRIEVAFLAFHRVSGATRRYGLDVE